MIKKVCVVGLGYIGLPTAIIAAEAGYDVVGVDIDASIVDKTNQAKMHFQEPFLDDLLASEISRGRLRAQTVPEASDAFVIAVPTPFKDGYEPDISAVEAAARSLAPVLAPGNLVIIESTVPVGTTERIRDVLRDLRSDLRFPENAASVPEFFDVSLVFCPERVLPGRIAQELRSNDRVIGGLTPACAARGATFYGAFVDGTCFRTGARTAELVKLTENAFRDVNIAFANELSMIADDLTLDPWEVIQLANRHPRVKILNPGPGVGGHCIAVDPWFIVHSSPEKAKLIRQGREVNLAKTAWVVEKVLAMIDETRAKSVALLGLAYKADADDLRESPAIDVARRLIAARRDVVFLLVEPHIDRAPAALAGSVLAPVDSALAEAALTVCLVAHSAFRRHIEAIVRRPHFDAAGLLASKG